MGDVMALEDKIDVLIHEVRKQTALLRKIAVSLGVRDVNPSAIPTLPVKKQLQTKNHRQNGSEQFPKDLLRN
jgi:hypothetical protein